MLVGEKHASDNLWFHYRVRFHLTIQSAAAGKSGIVNGRMADIGPGVTS
jgi:hypothetical protein